MPIRNDDPPAEYYDDSDNCVECSAPLDEEDMPNFCSPECQEKHVEHMRKMDNAYFSVMIDMNKHRFHPGNDWMH